MEHPYTLANIVKSPKGRITAELMEYDVVIGKVTRGAVSAHFVPPFEVKFLSSAARVRFDDFANCLSIGESVEALLPLSYS